MLKKSTPFIDSSSSVKILESHDLKDHSLFDHCHSKIIKDVKFLAFLNLYQHTKSKFILSIGS